MNDELMNNRPQFNLELLPTRRLLSVSMEVSELTDVEQPTDVEILVIDGDSDVVSSDYTYADPGSYEILTTSFELPIEGDSDVISSDYYYADPGTYEILTFGGEVPVADDSTGDGVDTPMIRTCGTDETAVWEAEMGNMDDVVTTDASDQVIELNDPHVIFYNMAGSANNNDVEILVLEPTSTQAPVTATVTTDAAPATPAPQAATSASPASQGNGLLKDQDNVLDTAEVSIL